MSWTEAAQNARADAVAALIVEVSLHSGNPGSDGTNQEWGDSSYARQAPVWETASGGVVNLTAPLEYLGNSGTGVSYFGLWMEGGVFAGAVERVGGDDKANGIGEYQITSLEIDPTEVIA